MTSLQALLGIDLPIIQAPMAGVQGSALAAAVSGAGGLGSLPCAMLGPDVMRTALLPYFEELGIDPGAVSAGTPRWPFSHEAADILEEFRPPVVSFHFGLPADDLIARVRDWGARVLSSATTVEEARVLEARGVDAVIAQGVEAGGHRGMFPSDDPGTQIGTFALVPQVAAAVRLGRDEFSPLWAGQNRSGCREVPAASVTRELASAVSYS